MYCAFSAGYDGVRTKCSAQQAVVWNCKGYGACGAHAEYLMRAKELAR